MADEHLPWFERLIRDAEAAGEFDDLPGKGKPIADLDRPYAAGWWAKRFVERERVNEAAIELAARMRRELPRLLAGRDEAVVRERLDAYNREIDAINAGQPEAERLALLDVDRILADRRRRHS